MAAACAEGAFGTVEERKLINADGTEARFAVKRLKKQDIPQEVLLWSPRGSTNWLLWPGVLQTVR